MAREIERKFLVSDTSILQGRTGMSIVQGYLAKEGMTVRVRSVAVRAFKAGANGYLNSESVPEELVWAVRKVTGGGKYISPSLAERLVPKVGGHSNDTPHERLSQHE